MFQRIPCCMCNQRPAVYRSSRYGLEICHTCLREVQLGLVSLLGLEFVDSMFGPHMPNLMMELGMGDGPDSIWGQFNINSNTARSIYVSPVE